MRWFLRFLQFFAAALVLGLGLLFCWASFLLSLHHDGGWVMCGVAGGLLIGVSFMIAGVM